jgi:hypothetical protein
VPYLHQEGTGALSVLADYKKNNSDAPPCCLKKRFARLFSIKFRPTRLELAEFILCMNHLDDIERSDLGGLFSENGKTVAIRIYKRPRQIWTLEIADEFDNATVYATTFESEEEAYAEALDLLKTEGINAFIGHPR